MNFKVYVIIEIPIISQNVELMVPIDRKIHDVVSALTKTIPELKSNYYANKIPNVYNKLTGEIYSMNTIIKDSNIKMGTRLIVI